MKIFHPDNPKRLTEFISFIRICPTMISSRSTYMNGLVKILLVFLFCTTIALAAKKPTVKSVHAPADVPLTTDPSSTFWSTAGIANLERDTQGKDVPSF